MTIAPGSRFTLKMARRDLRAGSRHFIPLLAGIALGVAAVVAVGTAADTIGRAVAREARSLLGADIEIRSQRALSDRAVAVIATLPARGAALTQVTELIAMAASSRASALVELKAVEEGYPFYGRLETTPDGPLALLLRPGPGSAGRGPGCGGIGGPAVAPSGRAPACDEPPPYGAVVQEAFLIRMGLAQGDRFAIGNAEFTIAAILRTEPDRAAGAFSLGPRVLIARDAVSATGLIQPGSRVRYRILARLPESLNAEAVRDELRVALADEPLQVVAYPDAQPQLRRTLDRLTSYLGLVGLAALFIGGVGVAVSIRAFLAEKWETIAVLKCVGAPSTSILRIYLLQVLALGLVGGVIGIGLGSLSHAGLTRLAAPLLAVDLSSGPSPWPSVRGVAMGILAALLFALWPLLQVIGQPPSVILRRQIARVRSGRRKSLQAAAVIGIGLGLLAWWQAGEWRLAGLFIAAVLAAGAVLGGAAWGVARLARAAPRPSRLAWRRGLANLHHPGARTTAVLVSIGVGVMMVVAVALVEHAVRIDLGDQIPQDAPSFFFIDIQPDQRDGFAELMDAHAVGIELTPVVRSRLVTVNGAPVGSEGPLGTPPEDRWYFTREYVLTYRRDLPPENAVVAGRWWDDGPSASIGGSPISIDGQRIMAQISVEDEAARHLGVGVGSTLVFDIQGVQVAARVANLRSVDWATRSTNFYVIFAPGALEVAPLTYIGAARVPPAAETRLQQAVVRAFPNVTAIGVRDILAAVARVLGRMSAAVRVVATFVVVAGFVVLTAALAATREARLREAMIFRSLGATRRAVGRAFAIEFAVLGAAAGAVGTMLAAVLAWVVLRFVLEISWQWSPLTLIAAVALTAAGTVAVGVASTHRLLGRRPFPVLRGE